MPTEIGNTNISHKCSFNYMQWHNYARHVIWTYIDNKLYLSMRMKRSYICRNVNLKIGSYMDGHNSERRFNSHFLFIICIYKELAWVLIVFSSVANSIWQYSNIIICIWYFLQIRSYIIDYLWGIFQITAVLLFV